LHDISRAFGFMGESCRKFGLWQTAYKNQQSMTTKFQNIATCGKYVQAIYFFIYLMLYSLLTIFVNLQQDS